MASNTSLSKIRDAIVEVRNAIRQLGPSVDVQSQRSAMEFLDDLEERVVSRCPKDGNGEPTLEMIPQSKK
jgi:hypothetical protein